MNTSLSRFRRAAWLQAVALAIMIPSLVVLPTPAWSNPAGGVVTHGLGEIGDGLNGHLQIMQHSDRMVINWESFNISAGELTQFVQPGSGSMALSRVISGNPSAIHGMLKANGGHILVNTNGILVGPGGRVDVGGMNVLSTLDVDPNQFMGGGDLRFYGNTSAGVTNFGTITSAGGDVILLGNFVDNQGTLGAVNGTVALGAGGEILLHASGDHKISILRGGAGGPVGVNNDGNITGAAVEMKAHGNVYALAINNGPGGQIRATGANRVNGRVILSAPGGTIRNEGDITATNANGDGGEILIDATGGTVELESGEIRADGASGGDGGSITVLGDVIGVGADALISASGNSGGSVIIGGDATSQVTMNGTIEAIGRAGDGGTVSILGNSGSVISVNGPIDASGTAQGGVININGGDVTQGPNATFDASGGISGGAIRINGAGVNTVNSVLDASGAANKGGSVIITGQEVLAKANTNIDVSGALGGGEVLIGGGFRGDNPDVPNATNTTVEDNVVINADATFANDGGTVVVWADNDTFYAGQIRARALGFVGDGGLIEVSGKVGLKVRGGVDASSVNGASGAVLFDPGDVSVGNVGTADIQSSTINTTLQGGTSVIIATQSDGGGNGDISFLNTGIDNDWHDAIQWTNSNASFGVFAAGNVDIKTHIRTSGRGSINIIAGWTGEEADLAGFGYDDPDLNGAFENSLGIGSVEVIWRFYVQAGQFGNFSLGGSVVMGGASTNRHVVVGSRFGNTNVAGGNLFMVTPQGNTGESDYVHLGFRDTGSVFAVRGTMGFDNATIDLNDRLLDRNNDPLVGINDPTYYRDIGTDGVADGVYAINSGGVLDATNTFAIANPGGQDGGPATLIPFANHFMSERFGNYWWQQIDGRSPDPAGLGGLAPEHGAGLDPAVTGDPISRADINVALTGGLLQQSGGRHQDYVQIGHGGDSTAWGDDKSLRGGNANLTNQSSRNVVQNGAGSDRTANGIGRLAGVFGNINVLTGLDPATARYDPSAPEINLTGVTDSQGGFIRLESWQNTASSNNINNPEQGNNSESYTQIGHLGTGQFGYVRGDINVSAGGNIDLLAGAHTRNHSTIGHTMNGFAFWNPPANEYAQIRFMNGPDVGDFDNPNLRKGELFASPTGGDARGFYELGNDGGRHDNDFWTAGGTPGVTGTAGEHPSGPVHVPALVGGVRKDIIGDIRVDSYGPRGITIKAFTNPDTRLITTDDSRTIGDLYDDINGNGVQDPGEVSRNPGDPAFSAESGARGANALDDGSDDDGLRRRTDRKFAGIGHGGSGFGIWNDNGTEQVHLTILAGDVDTAGANPGETAASLASESRTISDQGGTRRNRAPTFVNLIGNVTVNAHNGGVTMAAGNDTYDYAYIGHGGNDLSDYETSNVVIGDITVTGLTDLIMLGAGVVAAYTGETNRTSRSHVQIGHHTSDDLGLQYYGGDITVNFGGNIDMIGSRQGRSAAKIGHQGGLENWGQSGGTFSRLEHFLYGPQITDEDPNSATMRTLAVTFAGATVTDTDVTITFGDHNETSTYAIDGNTANISVTAGGNILMTHADPQLRVTQNMYARQQGTGANDLRWSPTAIGHGGRDADALRSNGDNRLYFFADKVGDIDVTAGSYQVDAMGNQVLDALGNPILVPGTGDITMHNGSFEGHITAIGHYYHDASRSDETPDNTANAYKLIGDINVTARNNLTIDSSFASGNDPVNFQAAGIGIPTVEHQIRIGHGADFNNLDIITLNDGSLVHGIAASSDIYVTVGNDLNMGYLRPTTLDAGDGFYEAFKTSLEDRIGLAIGSPVNFFVPDNDPDINEDDETYGGNRQAFSQIGHGYSSDVGNDPARPDGFNGDITVTVGNNMTLTAGRDAWIAAPGAALADFVESHAAWVGHGGQKLDGDLTGDISVYVGNNLTLNGSQREQTEATDTSGNPIGSIGNIAKIGHWTYDLDAVGSFQDVTGNHVGDITVVVGNTLTMNGGTTPDFAMQPIIAAGAQIGNSGPGVNGDKRGDITVLVGNDLITTDDSDNHAVTSNFNSSPQIGHGDWLIDGAFFTPHATGGPGARNGNITVAVGDDITLERTLIGHADPRLLPSTTITGGDTIIAAGRRFPFFNPAYAAASEQSGSLTTTNGTVFTSAFYGSGSELRLYLPQREANFMTNTTRLNESFTTYVGTPGDATPASAATSGTSFAAPFNGALLDLAGRGDEIYLQPDLWWDGLMTATAFGTPGEFPTGLAGTPGGSVATVASPGGLPNLVALAAGAAPGSGTSLDTRPTNYRPGNGVSGNGEYTLFYDAIETVGVVPPGPVAAAVAAVEAAAEVEIPEEVLVDLALLFDLFPFLFLDKFDSWDRGDPYLEGSDEGFFDRIGLFFRRIGPGGSESADENIFAATGDPALDTLAVLLGFDTAGEKDDDPDSNEARAARYRLLGRLYGTFYQAVIDNANAYSSNGVFGSNGLGL